MLKIHAPAQPHCSRMVSFTDRSSTGPTSLRAEMLGEPIQDITERGRRGLDRLELPVAEECFREVLQRLSGSSGTDQSNKWIVESLYGLGEVYSRLSRQVSHNEVEWFRRMFHSLLLYRQAMEFSRSSANDLRHFLQEQDEMNQSKPRYQAEIQRQNEIKKEATENIKYYQQFMGRSHMQVKLLEDCLTREVKESIVKHCIQARVVEEESFDGTCVLRGAGSLASDGSVLKSLPGTMIVEPGTIYPAPKTKNIFDSTWLYETLIRCVMNPKEEASTARNSSERDQRESSQSDFSRCSSVLEQDPECSMDSMMTQQTKCKINFSMVQEAIKKLVSEVSSDVWAKYDNVYKRVPRHLIEKRLASEIVLRLTPGSQNNLDLVSALEDAIQFDESREYFESQSFMEGSFNGEISESYSSSTLDRHSSSEDLDRFENESDEEDGYETIELNLIPCALHTSGKLPVENSIAKSATSVELCPIEDTKCSSSSQLLKVPQNSNRLDKNRLSPTMTSPLGNYGRSRDPTSNSHVGLPRSVSVPGHMNRPSNSVLDLSQTYSRESQKPQDQTSRNSSRPSSASNYKQKEKLPECKPMIFYNTKQTVGGLDCFGRMLHGVVSMWKAENETTNKPSKNSLGLQSIEELSALTEKDRSRKRLESENILNYKTELGESKFLNEAKLCQTVGHVAGKVAESFNHDGMAREACETFKYALAVYLDYLPDTDRIDIISDLILNIGMMKCNLGDTPCGVQLLDECVALYGGRTSVNSNPESTSERQDMFKMSRVSFQQGNALLLPEYRQDLLMTRMMKLVKREMNNETDEKQDQESDDGSDEKSTDDESDEEDYSVCNQEAITSYKNALNTLERLQQAVGDDSKMPPSQAELYIDVLSSLADCYVISGYLEGALKLYERTINLFQRTPGCSPRLMELNSHVICMIGSINFLLRNFIRAATMFETSYLLRQHAQGIPDEPTIEMAWSLCMLSLSYFTLGHQHKCVLWSVRSFTLYVRLYGGRLLDVDPLGHWFIVQALYMLGHAYLYLQINDKALNYLTLCKNMATRATSGQEDEKQVVKVLTALADGYNATDDRDSATKYYNQALEYCKELGDEDLATSIHNQLAGKNSICSADTDAQRQHELEKSIKRDMTDLLKNLGVQSTLSCDLDRAIGCYSKYVQAFGTESNKGEASDAISKTMADMATLCHVKACLNNNEKKSNEYLKQAEQHFQEALSLDNNSHSPVSVQYANFKYKQYNFAEALLTMLPFVFCNRSADIEIIYRGIEKAVLPICIQKITDAEIQILEARVLAKFLAVLCYKELRLMREAEEALIELYKSAITSSKSSNHIILGYAFLELNLVDEAFLEFKIANKLSNQDAIYESVSCYAILLIRKFKRTVDDLYMTISASSEFIARCHARQDRIIQRRRKARRTRQKIREDLQLDVEHSYMDRLSDLKAETETMARVAGLPTSSNKSHGVPDTVQSNENTSTVVNNASTIPVINNPPISIINLPSKPSQQSFSTIQYVSITQPNSARNAPQVDQNLKSSVQQRPLHRSIVGPDSMNPSVPEGLLHPNTRGERQESEQASHINDRLSRINETLKTRFGQTLSSTRAPPTQRSSYLRST